MEGRAVSVALEEMDRVYSFMVARVGNRADAEDLTQQVALKALPRLREDAEAPAIRSYLFATARSVLGGFWTERFRLSEAELADDVPEAALPNSAEPSVAAAAWLEQTLSALPPQYRQVLELRFLRGQSIREVALHTHRTPGAVKVMQLRALRAAAAQPTVPLRYRPERPRPAAARGSACAPRPATPVASTPRR